jgi:GxxExxY protein
MIQTDDDINRLTGKIIGAAIEVHKNLGPGLLESAYEECLCYELSSLGIRYQRQVKLPVRYKEVDLDCGYRMDLVVEDQILVELKSIETLMPIHEAQLMTYMKRASLKIGLLINFNVDILKHGIRRKKIGYFSNETL